MRPVFFALLMACSGAGCSGMKPIYTPGTDDTSGSTGTNFGDLYLSPDSIDFGDTTVGELSTADVLLRNDGVGELNLTDTIVSGDSAFSLESSLSLPMTLAAGDESIITLGFTPATDVSYAGTFRVAVYGEDGYGSVPLTGDGVEEGSEGGGSEGGGSSGGGSGTGSLELSATSVSFGTVDIHEGATHDITLTNGADEDILIVDFESSDSAFVPTADFTTPGVLSVGETSTLTISFEPTLEKAYSGTITLVTDPETYGAVISVSGTGYSSCDVCQPIIDVTTGGSDDYSLSISMFTATDGYSKSAPVTIKNTGDQDLEISAVTINNDSFAACGAFSSNWGGSALTLAAGETTSIAVTYTVTESCFDIPVSSFDSNYMHILSNDPSEPDYGIGLSGTAL